MPTENLTTYTEVDPGNRLAETSSRVTFTLKSNETAYLYKDKGVNHFDGSFTFYATLNITTSSPFTYQGELLAISNDLNNWQWLKANGKSGLGLFIYDANPLKIVVTELDSGAEYGDFGGNQVNLSYNVTYYLKIVRNESVGTYGTYYLYVYSDSLRTALVGTSSVALHTSKKDYRYMLPCLTRNDGLNFNLAGYIENIELNYFESVIHTTSPITSIADTTALAIGEIIRATASASQYGHVWATSTNPTVASHPGGNLTTKGAPGTTTAFSSNLTGLTAHTKYYVKAYITDSFGTHYGNEVEFITLGKTAPTVTTQAATSITANNAVGNGNVVNAGGYTISKHGIAWATHPHPTHSDSYAETASGALGTFTEAMTPLLVNNVYYAAAYVLTSTGLYFYGSDVTFTTSAGLPIVTTKLTTKVNDTTAIGNLILVNNGGSLITQYGVAYSLSSHANPGNVLPSASSYELYTAEGAYSVTPWPVAGVKRTSAIADLTPNTLYYLRAYATNSTGTAYGDEVSFTTKIVGAPTVTTDDIFAMTYTAATVRGTIIDLGMSAVTEHGIVWSTSANPTTADSKAVDAGPQAIGQFAEDAISLTTGTTYYVRAYATNTQGTGYGDNIEFVAGTPPAGTYFNPADQFTRVSGIVRRWYPGLGGLAVYEAVLLLGGTSITYIPPIGNRETPSSAAPETLPSGQDFSLSNFNKYIDNLKSKMPVNTDNMTALRPLPTYSAWVKWAASLIRQGNK